MNKDLWVVGSEDRELRTNQAPTGNDTHLFIIQN